MAKLFQACDTQHNVWIKDPRWTWYGTPIWRTTATLILIKTIEPDPFSTRFNTGSLTSKEPPMVRLLPHHIYLTDEEYVMWKLSGIESGEYDIDRLRRDGTIYN